MCNSCQSAAPQLDRRFFLKLTVPVLVGLTLPAHGVLAAAKTLQLPAPTPQDTCPVCGMFVAKYPYWIATVLFKDNHADHFDGAKDFFKYLLDMPKYARGRSREEIAAMGVTGYYSGERIDAVEAHYVIGSDTLGPMGHEFVPLVDEAEAKEFMSDHKGRRVVRFSDVTIALTKALDDGKFD